MLITFEIPISHVRLDHEAAPTPQRALVMILKIRVIVAVVMTAGNGWDARREESVTSHYVYRWWWQ